MDHAMPRLEANRHRVMRDDNLVRASPTAYLKIVAPVRGCAIVEQHNRQVCVTPVEWSIYDTTPRYAVDNPVRVEHLILMVPRASLDELMAGPFGNRGGVSRSALETMRSAWERLPTLSLQAASAVGEVITRLVHLSLTELAGHASGFAQRESPRDCAVADISVGRGFSSAAYFSRAFRHRVGMSPGECPRQARGHAHELPSRRQ